MILVPSSSYYYLLPEIIVALTGVVLIVADLIWPAHDEATGHTGTWPAYVAIFGLLAAAAAVLPIAGTTQTLFNGIIEIDPLSAFFQLLFIAIGVLVILMSVETVPKFTRWTAEFYALIAWTILGSMLLASAAELFTIFLSLQLTSLPLIVLVGYAKRDPRSGEAALKYLLLVLVSTAVLLYGMSLIYGSLGTSTLSEIGAKLATQAHIEPVIVLGLVLLLSGFAFKITAAPFHYWVPDAYEGAPTPVTAFMSVGSKFAGFALALRVITAAERVPLNWRLVFGVMAALSMTLGNLGAIRQTNIKRMLAYSSIAQAGFILIGVLSASEQGLSSTMFYLVAYGFATIGAFAVVSLVRNAGGEATHLSNWAGLGKRSPVLAGVFTLFLLAFAGIPLTSGFTSKFAVFEAGIAGGAVPVVVVGVFASAIAAFFYVRVIVLMFFSEPAADGPTVVVPSAFTTVALALAVAATVLLGILPGPVLDLANNVGPFIR